jgi:hypothetical protein
MKRLAIMQPYFFPYIGYFQLIQAVDQFIVYDNIQYAKKGWITRNRYLEQGKDRLFSLPLGKASDFLDVKDRVIAADFRKDKFLNRLREAYRHAPSFAQVFPLVENVVLQNESNLFSYIYRSIRDTCDYLAIDTEIIVSSSLPIDHFLRGKDKVLALCRYLAADVYVNSIGGRELYAAEDFSADGIELRFLRTKPFEYRQFDNEFVPSLSIIDVMMFNTAAEVRRQVVSGYELI